MHDNASCHTSRAVKAYLADAGLELLDWPPFSPDLNPIENIWGWIKFQLYSKFPRAETRDELIDFVFEIWEKIDRDMCQIYCGTCKKRLEAVKKSRGDQQSINFVF
jgi:transposase